MTTDVASRTGFQPTGQLHFGVNLVGPSDGVDFQQLRTLAQTAERGLFSLLTLDERYWLGEDPGAMPATDPTGTNDVATLLAALAAVTTNIGLVAAAAPNDNNPAAMVHRIASLDRVSGGRAGWHLLPAGSLQGALEDTGPDGGGRAALMERVHGLWDAWGESGRSRNGATQGPVEHVGAFERHGQRYAVGLGQLRQPAPGPRPVIVHGASSPRDLAFAAKHADVATSVPAGLGDALALRRELVAGAVAAGRAARAVKIFQTGTFILGETDGEAVEKAEWIRGQLPDAVWDKEAFVGSYSGIADLLLDFARSGAVDGFTVMPWLYPGELTDIVNQLVPRLQDRGIYPENYSAGSLRDHLGLPSGGRDGSVATHVLPVIEVGDLEDIRLDLDLRMELIVQKLQA
jgi:alkanesulfonate monooxygenase SsuD/methylene tetrahydromethanopterin reductase-like flavin-dependent oxidoreductase (luciferase family)